MQIKSVLRDIKNKWDSISDFGELIEFLGGAALLIIASAFILLVIGAIMIVLSAVFKHLFTQVFELIL